MSRGRPPSAMLLDPAAETYISVIIEGDGLKTVYSFDQDHFVGERFSRRIIAEMEWFERVVHHQPTVGQFYEVLIRNALSEQCPKLWEVSTGFVLDPVLRRSSSQLDVIIHNRAHLAPVFESGELVVADPSAVISVSEIKKTLTLRDVKTTVEKTFFHNLGSHRHAGVQSINIFGFNSKLNIKSLLNPLKNTLDDLIEQTKVRHKQTNRVGKMVLSCLTIPNVFLLDSPLFVETNLRNVGRGEFKIEISLQHSHESSGSLGSYLLKCLRGGEVRRSETGGLLTHLAPPLSSVKESVLTENTIFLHTPVPMHVLAERYPQDIEQIRGLRVRGEQPFEALIPKEFTFNRFNSFNDLLAAIGEESFKTGIVENH